MTDHTPHPLDALNNAPEQATNGPQFTAIDTTMDGITQGAAEVLNDLGQGFVNFLKGTDQDKEKESEKDDKQADKQAETPEQDAQRSADQPEARSPDLTRERTLDPPQHIQDMVNKSSAIFEAGVAANRQMSIPAVQKVARRMITAAASTTWRWAGPITLRTCGKRAVTTGWWRGCTRLRR